MRLFRACALAVVVALATGVPLATPRGCVICPPDCPMHVRHADGRDSASRLGCHRQPADGQVCLRSACGNHGVGEAATVLRAVLSTGRLALPAPRASAAPPQEPRIASVFAPEPPTDPPRA